MTKDAVIAILKNQTEYLSGEKISKSLGISRAAVNAAIQMLRREGYDIASSTNRGYLLNHAPDSLNMGDLLALLPARRMETVLCLDTVDSTNSRLRDMAQNGAPEGQIVLANEQTEGRGRMGRRFSSPREKGIYLSVLLRPKGAPADATALTAWTAVAVSNAVENVCGVRPGIKWVNDLVMGARKICGILTEMSIEGENGHIQFVIVGIGLNVNRRPFEFPPEIQDTATSLLTETGHPYARALLAAEVIKELDRLRSEWPGESKKYWDAYCNSSLTVGKEVRILSGGMERTGFATAITEQFGLRVRFPNGKAETVIGGEVSVRGS